MIGAPLLISIIPVTDLQLLLPTINHQSLRKRLARYFNLLGNNE